MGSLPPKKLIAISAVVSFGGAFHFGFHQVMTNPSQAAFLKFLSDSRMSHYGSGFTHSTEKTVWSLIVACLPFGAIFGSLFIGFVSTRLGRKRGLYFSICLSICAVVLSIISFHLNSFELYTISRIMLGFAMSLSLGLSAIFLNESSPKRCRGFVSITTGITVQIGTLTGAIIAMPTVLGNASSWWYLYLMEIVVFLLVLAIMPFIPESPAFLTLKGDEEGARRAIVFFHGCKIGAVDKVLYEIKENLKLNATTMTAMEVFRGKYSRKGTIVGIVISFATCFSGTAVIYAYAVQILKNTGLSTENAGYGNIGLCTVSLISSVISAFVIDRFGRRQLLISTNAVIVFLNFIIFGFMYCFDKYEFSWLGFCLIGVIAVFLFIFSIGFGCLCFFVASELVGQAARGIAQSYASLAQMICRAFLLSAYLPISDAIGQPFSYFTLFVAPVIASFIFLYFKMPETKNRSHKEVIEAMRNLPSVSGCFRTKKMRSSPQDPYSDIESSLSSSASASTIGTIEKISIDSTLAV